MKLTTLLENDDRKAMLKLQQVIIEKFDDVNVKHNDKSLSVKFPNAKTVNVKLNDDGWELLGHRGRNADQVLHMLAFRLATQPLLTKLVEMGGYEVKDLKDKFRLNNSGMTHDNHYFSVQAIMGVATVNVTADFEVNVILMYLGTDDIRRRDEFDKVVKKRTASWSYSLDKPIDIDKVLEAMDDLERPLVS